ncbi:MAG: glycosyltransferase family 39 protein [Candidatus Rokubacteria bacterium]|nr:glycosyltransferase family 39 protein [Candidatus Rokubacteria bacterium]
MLVPLSVPSPQEHPSFALTPERARAVLFLGALGVRLAALGASIATARFPEFWEYEHIAQNLLHGRGFVYAHMGTDYRAYVEPLYPWLVTGTYLVAGPHALALAAVQCVLSALTAVALYEVARCTFGPRTGFAAGALLTLHPALAWYATKFHPLVLDALFITLVVLTTLRLARQPGLGNAVLVGMALGACVLTRPTILAFVPAALAWVAWRRAWPGTRLLALSLTIAALIVGPWIARNYAALGTLVLTRTNTGYVFWLGNHPGSTGGASDASGRVSLFDAAPSELRQRILAVDEVTQNRIFLTEALDYVRADPDAFVGRTLLKLGYFWWKAPYSGRGYARSQLALYHGVYVALIVLAAVGLLAARRDPVPGQADGVALALALLATISVTQSLFYVDARHRLAVEPLLVVFSGHGLVRILLRDRILRGRRREAAREPVRLDATNT